MEMLPATWQDIEHILAHLCDANREEYEAVGFPSMRFNTRLIQFCFNGDTRCLWFDNRPQAFIAIGVEQGVRGTWLGMTEACLTRGAGPIKIGRKYMAEQVAKYGRIHSIITSTHPQIVKWMRLLGAELVGEVDGNKVFEFS